MPWLSSAPPQALISPARITTPVASPSMRIPAPVSASMAQIAVRSIVAPGESRSKTPQVVPVPVVERPRSAGPVLPQPMSHRPATSNLWQLSTMRGSEPTDRIAMLSEVPFPASTRVLMISASAPLIRLIPQALVTVGVLLMTRLERMTFSAPSTVTAAVVVAVKRSTRKPSSTVCSEIVSSNSTPSARAGWMIVVEFVQRVQSLVR